MSFYLHLQAASQIWSKYQNAPNTNDNPTIVFTTESKAVAQDQTEFANNLTLQKTLPFAFGFVTNSYDVQQGTGFIKDIKRQTIKQQVSAEDVMLSTLSSLKLQLLAPMTMGNCCSNFHNLLNDLLTNGCGAATENSFHCLQEHEDMQFRVCCLWDKRCQSKKKKYFESRNETLPSYSKG